MAQAPPQNRAVARGGRGGGPEARPGAAGPSPAGADKAAADKADAAARKEAAKFNAAPPPLTSYTADVALAMASAAMAGRQAAAAGPAAAPGVSSAPHAKVAVLPGRWHRFMLGRPGPASRRPAAAWFTRTGLPGRQRPGAWFSRGSDSGRAQGEKRKALGFGGPVLNPAARKHSEAAAASLAPFGDSSGIGAKLLAQMGFGTAGSGLGRAGQVRRRRSRLPVSEERIVGSGHDWRRAREPSSSCVFHQTRSLVSLDIQYAIKCTSIK